MTYNVFGGTLNLIQLNLTDCQIVESVITGVARIFSAGVHFPDQKSDDLFLAITFCMVISVIYATNISSAGGGAPRQIHPIFASFQ